MNKEIFVERKESLVRLIKECLAKTDTSEKDIDALNKLLKLLNQYSFDNRLIQKGLLSHTIIDSLEIHYSLGDSFIKFDNDIK